EAADVAGLAMVEENLKTLRADVGGAQHDAGIRRPVRPCFEDELEVAEGRVADEIAAEAAAGRVLAADDGAVLNPPLAGMGIGPPPFVCVPARPRVARDARRIVPRHGVPAGERHAVEDRLETIVVARHLPLSPFSKCQG